MRLFSLVAGIAATTLVGVACSSGGDGATERSATTVRRSSATTTSQAAQPADPDAARGEITVAFETFLDAGPGDAEPPGVTGQVESVAFTSATEATVLITILVNGQPALRHFPGTAVLEDGGWKVSRTTSCDLLAQSGITCPADDANG